MRFSRRIVVSGVVAAATIAATFLSAAPALASTGEQSMYRLYNPYSGEHFYTASEYERNSLDAIGWIYEGVGWKAPTTGDPVYRLYNPYNGEHHYTLGRGERDALVAGGWIYEGKGWSSGGSVALWRQYNPYASVGSHNFTPSAGERDALVRVGWKDEGVGWYGIG